MARDFYSQLGTSEYSIQNLICFKEPSQWHHVCFYKTVIYGRHFAHRSGKLRPGSFLRRSCGPLAPQPSPGIIGNSDGNQCCLLELESYDWSVVLTILKNISQWERIIAYIMENKKCLKPPTRWIMMGISLETIGVSQSAPTRMWFLELQKHMQKLQWQRLPFLRSLSPTGDHGISQSISLASQASKTQACQNMRIQFQILVLTGKWSHENGPAAGYFDGSPTFWRTLQSVVT